MALCWNFREILNLNTDLDTFTCFANEHIHELRHRCTKPIDSEDYETVRRILRTIDTSPNPEVIFHELGRLSSLTLCKYHQNNDSKQNPAPSSEIYSQWKTLFQETWRDRREELRKDTESYKTNKMKQQLDQIKLCLDDEKDEQIFSSSSLPTTPKHQISSPSSPPSSNAVSPTDTSFLKPDSPVIRRDTFGNDAGPSPFGSSQDPLPKYLLESDLDRRPSLRILVQSVLLPSPPQTPELPGEQEMDENYADYIRASSSRGSYYSESSSSSPASPHPKPLRINSRNNNNNVNGNEFLFPTELAPRIPPKSPLRPKSSNFNTKFPIIKTTIIPLRSPTELQSQDQHSPISPLSSHHSKSSSCSSTNTNTSFLPSRSSFNSFTSFTLPPQNPSSTLSPFPFPPSHIPNFPGRENAQKTNSSTPKIRAPTPTSPTFTKRPKFLIQDEYAEDPSSFYQEEEETTGTDYFSASLNLNPYHAVTSETSDLWKRSESTPPQFPDQIPPKSIRRRTGNFVDTKDKDSQPRDISRDEGKRMSKYTFTPPIPSPVKDHFESSLFCGVCRLARGEGTCGCLYLNAKSTGSIHTTLTAAPLTFPSSEKRGSEWGLAGGKEVCRGVKKLVKGVVGRLVGKEGRRRNTTGGVVENCEKGFVGGAAIRRVSK
ncbi:hypothetical protein HYFRA_00007970 [Hymenoscyphus fraxineus]|uniref:Uncharacterized protein n=1 Tax=Hymenoscyphus fraxineus TaxID=746836 RepID=A0A9N9KR63_9HELO|nr:hypothetical protein HYFRA_00007970 [Hymenoscyphus fraxineus]